MYRRYHIDTRPAPSKYRQIGRFQIERSKRCINCGKCTLACLFKVHRKRKEAPQLMAEPKSERCRGCFRCIFICPSNALTISKNPEFYSLGNNCYTPEIINTIWYEASGGKIPVTGAGYRGPFSGPGFDSIWTDMSEIVRPTRDGIHGREYISTSVDIGRKPSILKLTPEGGLAVKPPPLLEIAFPVIFDTLPLNVDIRAIASRAAFELGTYAIMEMREGEKLQHQPSVIPLLREFESPKVNSGIIEVEYGDNIIDRLSQLKQASPDLIISMRIPASNAAIDVEELVRAGADIIHLHGENIKDTIISVHRHLVERAVRDEVTLIAGGGIALAEHAAKAIICGADAVAIDLPLLIALGCRVCDKCESTTCEPKLSRESGEFATQRIKNLMAAWRDQLLEVLGAMGIREVRRLRGEAGRAMFLEDLEKELLCAGEGGK